jgi:hypothetical protein
MQAARGLDARLATTTIYRPDPKETPGAHEITYHLLVKGIPLTIKVLVPEGVELPSIRGLFINADWEEREVMELTGIAITGHEGAKRLFLDESIEAGIFDRLVPFSEMTNANAGDATWARIKEQSRVDHPRREAWQKQKEGQKNG